MSRASRDERTERTERNWPRRLLRTTTGIAVLGLTAAVVAGAVRLPVPAPGSTTGLGAATVAVPPAPTTLLCPGPVILPDDAGRGDAAFDPVPVDPSTAARAVVTGTSGGAVTPLGGAAPVATLGSGSSGAGVAPLPGALVVRADAGDDPARLAATSGSLVTAGDLRGLAAASCQVPTTDAWLVGGATDLTSTAHLVLDNAGATAAEVVIEVFGPAGPVDLSGERYLVAPGAERVVPLGAIAAQQRGVVVHVSADGGRVAAHVQDSALDGFTPAGTEIVVPGATPARHLVVPAVSVLDSAVGGADAAVLRLLAPGTAATTVGIQILGPAGPVDLPGADSVALDPGAVTDVPLGGLPAGTYTVVLDADEPVAAGVVVSRTGMPGELDPTPPVERAWSASAVPGDGVVALPAGATGTLVVGGVGAAGESASARSARATLRLLAADGAVLGERTLALDARTTGAWSLDELAAGTGAVGAGAVPGAPTGVAPGSVAAVDLVASSAVPLSWGLVAQVAGPDGALLSVLLPVRASVAAPDVTVVEDPRLGTR